LLARDALTDNLDCYLNVVVVCTAKVCVPINLYRDGTLAVAALVARHALYQVTRLGEDGRRDEQNHEQNGNG
jgi:hypothetical protein